jgi:L-fuconolactonase
MKIDAHQHFWIYKEQEYSWIDERMSKLKHEFMPADLLKELDQAGFSGSVAIQARQSVEETRWLLSLSQQYAFIKGVVGWVDLQSEKIEENLIEFAGEQKFVGVRHVIQDEEDVNFMLKKEFMRGIAYLQDYGLTYDLLIQPQHLKAARQLVRKFPELKFVVDHLAKPAIKNRKLEPWASDLKDLARYDNVYCKLSGMVTEGDWEKWHPSDFRPYMDMVIESFGPDRTMIGSDWPVCLLAGSYQSVSNLVLDYIKQCSENEQDKIKGNTCIDFYSLRIN